jgi:lipopolysaccharide/colanic/teichoic acid biosynthesis glycosyltransferase
MEEQGEVRTINLEQIINRNSDQLELKIRNETDEDAEARRTCDAADAKLKRTQSLILFLFALFVTAMVFIACIVVAIIGSPEDKKWACSIVTGISSGLVGYLVGHAKK